MFRCLRRNIFLFDIRRDTKILAIVVASVFCEYFATFTPRFSVISSVPMYKDCVTIQVVFYVTVDVNMLSLFSMLGVEKCRPACSSIWMVRVCLQK